MDDKLIFNLEEKLKEFDKKFLLKDGQFRRGAAIPEDVKDFIRHLAIKLCDEILDELEEVKKILNYEG